MDGSAKKAIQDRWDAYESIALAKDVEGWASYWTSDARIFEPGMDLSGDDLFAFGKEFFESGGEIFSLDVSRLRSLCMGMSPTRPANMTKPSKPRVRTG